MNHPAEDQALRGLEFLIGEWTLQAIGPDGQSWREARVTYEWHDSRAHVVERVQPNTPDTAASISIMGCDAGNGTYYQLYSNDRGSCRVYEMSITESEWKRWRRCKGTTLRFTSSFDDGGDTIRGRWELAEDRESLRTGTDPTYQQVNFDLIYRRIM